MGPEDGTQVLRLGKALLRHLILPSVFVFVFDFLFFFFKAYSLESFLLDFHVSILELTTRWKLIPYIRMYKQRFRSVFILLCKKNNIIV